jgi:hypothetical protein
MVNKYNKTGAKKVNVTFKNNDRSILESESGLNICGVGIETDYGLLAHKDDNGNYHVSAPLSTLNEGALVKCKDDTTGELEDSIVLETSNGVNLNMSADQDVYYSLGSGGYEKVWLTRKANSNNFAISLSSYSGDALILDQVTGKLTTPVGIGVGVSDPNGVEHLLKDLSTNLQLGINKNVGPIGTGFTRDSTKPMINASDSGVLTNGNLLQFLFTGNYQGIFGHGEIHVYDISNGDSYFCHFSIRFVSEATSTITLDFGDISGGGQKFFIADSGAGIRLLITASAGPNYNPILVIKNSFGSSVDISYNLYLRKLLFS